MHTQTHTFSAKKPSHHVLLMYNIMYTFQTKQNNNKQKKEKKKHYVVGIFVLFSVSLQGKQYFRSVIEKCPTNMYWSHTMALYYGDGDFECLYYLFHNLVGREVPIQRVVLE